MYMDPKTVRKNNILKGPLFRRGPEDHNVTIRLNTYALRPHVVPASYEVLLSPDIGPLRTQFHEGPRFPDVFYCILSFL